MDGSLQQFYVDARNLAVRQVERLNRNLFIFRHCLQCRCQFNQMRRLDGRIFHFICIGHPSPSSAGIITAITVAVLGIVMTLFALRAVAAAI